MKAWRPNCTSNPVAAYEDEEVRLLEQPGETAQHDESEQADDHQAGEDTQLLAGDGKDEIGMGIRQNALNRPFAGAASEQSAIAGTLRVERSTW